MRTSLVLGLGETGLAMARWAHRGGDAVRAWDSRAAPPNESRLADDVPGVTLLPNRALDAADLDGVDRVAKSPGLAPHDPKIAVLLAAAAARGVPVDGELDVFFAALEALRAEIDYAPKLLAVTGTNGKTTTTALTARLLERAGRRVAVAGNIGPTMLQTLADAIDAGPRETLRERLPELWVLELSSFQLADASRVALDAAALLNLGEDHLDWHGDRAAYAAAKAKIFGERAAIVIDRDDAALTRLVPPPKALPPARKGRPAKVIARRVVSFGASPPRRPGDFGLVVENGMTWLARASADDVAGGSGGDAVAHLQPLMPADALRIRGRHNALNALAALALATTTGAAMAPMLHALRDYRGEPHRVELVATIDGIDAWDDSKGTNVHATVAALEGLGNDRGGEPGAKPGAGDEPPGGHQPRLVVILGGDGKGQDFAPLGPALARHAKAAMLIGRDAEAIGRVAEAAGVACERHDTLEAATRAAFARAAAGDAVLLSPACASLDMFRHYAHRAEVFVAAVREIAAERGQA